jgi:hypothetical protein
MRFGHRKLIITGIGIMGLLPTLVYTPPTIDGSTLTTEPILSQYYGASDYRVAIMPPTLIDATGTISSTLLLNLS